MRKQMLSILLSLCMLFFLAPASVFAQDELEETDECICETQCSEESINNDCPVCSKEGANLEDCRMYVPVIEESNETVVNQLNENNNEESNNTVILEDETNEESNNIVLENEESSITSKDVQDLIDTLPDPTTINEDNVEEIEAQLEAIDNLKADLSDEELDGIDFTRYVEVATVLEQLLYGVQESSNQIMPASYSGRSIRLGTSGISSPTEITDQNDSDKKSYSPNSYIYFGAYNNTPIKWRVLDANRTNVGTTNGMFLLSEYLLASDLAFNGDGGTENKYQGSEVQKWCIDFAKNLNNFSTLEQGAMLGITKNDGVPTAFHRDIYTWGESSLSVNDKMFLLSVQEVADYVANYDGPILDTSFLIPGFSAKYWWLRTPALLNGDKNNCVAAYHFDYGFIGDILIYRKEGASRPAFNLDSNNVLFTSPAKDGKFVDDLYVGSNLKAVGTTNSTEWKLTLKDSSRSSFKASTSANFAKPGENITITYSGAKKGSYEHVSAMIVDKNDDVLYYGRIAQKSESGTATVTIPTDIAPGDYRLKIFNEQCNDDYRTDYASDFVNIDLTIREKLSEQFNLSTGEKYYFDLSGLNIPGTVNSYLLDSSLHYVPFVYTGTVDAYVLKPASNHVADSSKQASDTLNPNAQYGYTYDHSLFIADEPITGNVSWADLNEKGFIFGNSYVTNGINYTLRAPTVGSTLNSSNPEMPDPSNNEWNRIINKNKNYIKTQLFGFDLNWGQDNYNEDSLNKKSTRSVNFNNSLRGTEEENKIGTYYRPVLEILDAKTLGSEGLKAITLNFGGGKLGGSGDDIKIVVGNNGTYTAPSYEGLTRPDGNSDTYFYWLDSDGNSYIPGGAVSSDVTTLTAKWEPLKYSVTLEPNGGVINNNNIIEYVYGQGATLPSASDMEKEYHIFGGWYTSSDFSGSPVTEISHVDKGDKIYYAKWNANQYTITFDTGGGSNIPPITQDYGTTITKPSNPTKEGYTFKGWDKEIPDIMPTENITIKALWDVNKYTITFDTDGGSTVSPITQDYGTTINKPSDPIKTEYTFAGWEPEIPATMPANNITIKAKWNVKQYTITFDTDGGSNVDSITQDYGSAVVKPLDPTKTGYTFAGWDKTIPATMPAENITIKAKWNINQYTITFDTDGGSVVSPITQDYGTRIDKPSDPTREGYTFMVWDNAIPNTMPAHDMLIKALWKINKYTVTFDSDGGSNIDPITLDYGSVITKPSNPTKTGHIFVGWFKDGTLFDFNAPLTMDITLKANWIKDDFIVKFDTDGGSIIADKTSVKWNDKLLDDVLVPNKTGHTFNGWKYNGIVVTENTKYSDLAGESVPTSIILKAYWTANQYTITFDTDGGSVVSPITQDYGTTVVKPSNPAKTGYVFAGWIKNGILFDFNTPLVDDITLKANWIEDNFTVKFDADGGSSIADKTNVKWNDKVLEDVIAPTKTGYTFNAWKYNNTVVIENTKYSDLAGDNVPTSITLKANWNVNQYTISFNTDGGNDIPSITQDFGSDVVAPNNPTKTGYTFAGWDKVVPSTMPSSDLNIKALWKINKYTITFDTNGGSNIDSITQDFGSTITKPLDPTRSGYTFVGWDKEVPSTMPSYDMTIKAKWLDSEKPSGEIKVATNSWKTLLNNISFGLFFRDSQTVSISAIDNSNEEVKIEYLLSNSLLSITELDNQTFNLYTKPFSINPNNEYVIYAKLTDTSNNISYISSDGLVLDDISPLISGIEDNKTYCEKKTVTVNDKYINSVKVNGNDVTLDSNNSFILGYGKQNIIVTDKSGNRSEVNVTINNGHSFGGYNFDGVDTHTRKCNICGSSETYKCIDENKDHKCDVCSGQISKCVDLNKNHKCDICGKTISSHKGGEASCTKKSICEICGQEYGELSKHLNLKHIEETKATTTSTGNKEYWYCEECNRYYSDKDGLNEISKEDTVIGRLKDDATKDNNVVEIEHKDSNPIIWVVVPIVGVAIISVIILIIKRVKH